MILTDLKVNNMKNPIGISGETIMFSWIITSEITDLMQISYRIRIYKDNIIFWDSMQVDSAESAYVIYEGPTLDGAVPYGWTVEIKTSDGNTVTSDINLFELAIKPAQMKSQWIEPNLPEIKKVKNPSMLDGLKKTVKYRTGASLNPSSYLRKDFKCINKISSARLSVTAHGVYEVHLNGKRVGDRYFAPEYTSYFKNLLFQTYDVGEYLKEGGNSVGVIIGDGWWGGSQTGGKNCVYGDKHGLWLQLDIVYTDGTKSTICSDKSFNCSTGPIVFSDIFIGEKYDANLELAGWAEFGYDDSSWQEVTEGTDKKCILNPQDNEPVRIVQKIKPRAIFKTPKGETILDVGENVAGFLTLKITAEKGTRITMQHTEVLDKDGNYFHNLMFINNLQMLEYICKGEKRNGQLIQEEYTPHFSFQGFRFVRLTGDIEFSLDNFEVNILSTDNRTIGSFDCSDERLNRLQKNIVNSQTANFISIPTDCPQRERDGWTGDIQAFSPTACFNQDSRNFLGKWMKDLRLDQDEEGIVPQTVPVDPNKFPSFLGAKGIAGWSDACVIVPYTLYRKYGDKKILSDNYDAMKKWLKFVQKEASEKNPRKLKRSKLYRKDPEFRELSENLWNTGMHYGDWLVPSLSGGNILNIFKGAFMTKEIFASAYYARVVEMMSEISNVLKLESDHKFYTDLHKKIKKAFQRWFLNDEGIIQPDMQGNLVIALQFNLIPEEDTSKNVERLVSKIAENGGCLDTGFLSVPYLLDALSKHDRLEEAYRLLFQDKCPSWLYEVDKGATSIWETWAGIGEDGVPKPCSYNHYAFGSVGDWMYRNIGGLVPREPGYKSFIIQPQLNDAISHATVSHKSVYGEIKISWRKQNGRFEIDFSVPVNTNCTLILPDGTSTQYGSGKYHSNCAIVS